MPVALTPDKLFRFADLSRLTFSTEKILRIGVALARAGRTAEARACLQFFVEAAPPSRYRRDIERARVWLKQSG